MDQDWYSEGISFAGPRGGFGVPRGPSSFRGGRGGGGQGGGFAPPMGFPMRGRGGPPRGGPASGGFNSRGGGYGTGGFGAGGFGGGGYSAGGFSAGGFPSSGGMRGVGMRGGGMRGGGMGGGGMRGGGMGGGTPAKRGRGATGGFQNSGGGRGRGGFGDAGGFGGRGGRGRGRGMNAGGGGFPSQRGGRGFGDGGRGFGAGGRGFGGGRGRGGFNRGGGHIFGQGGGANRGKGVKRPLENVDPTKWIEEYDKELPQEILDMCAMDNCALCSVPLNGPAVAKSHYEGRNHERKVQQALQELYPDPDMAPKRIKTESESEAARQPKVKVPKVATEEDDDTEYLCEVCNMPCTSKLVYESHLAGKTHASRVRAQELAAQGNMYGMRHCEICNIYAAPDQYPTHVAGKQHQRRLLRANREASTFRCDICGVSSLDEHGHNVHMAGKRHKDKVEGLEKKAAGVTTDGEEAAENGTEANTVANFNCGPCQMTYVDADALELHCSGDAHKIVVAKVGLMEAVDAKVIDYNEIDYAKFSE